MQITKVVEMCGCEHESHFAETQEHRYAMVEAGETSAMYVGRVCDHCAKTHMKGFIHAVPKTVKRSRG